MRYLLQAWWKPTLDQLALFGNSTEREERMEAVLLKGAVFRCVLLRGLGPNAAVLKKVQMSVHRTWE